MEIRVKYVVVFQKDGLDETIIDDLNNNYGTVFDVEDNELDENTPVKMYYIDGTFGQFTKIKWDLNCVAAETNQYVLFPMASREDAMIVNNSRKKQGA